MKRIMRCILVLVIAGINCVSAQEKWENNGFFVGLGIGVGEGGALINSSLGNAKTSQVIINYDAKVGYKYFFNEWVGLRSYFNIGNFNTKNKVASDPAIAAVITEQDFNIHIVNYNINVDLLVNFYNTETYNIGFLGGVGFGGSDVIFYDKFLGRKNSNNAQVDIKTGVRLTSQKNNSIELIATIPMLKQVMDIGSAAGNLKFKFKQNYSISMNYIYSF